jgi:regulator of PEP synthase PpsR (kinase-PPPase family)
VNRTVFYVSESTGITAETLGHSLLSQFEGIDFAQVYMPYINTRERALELLQRLEEVTRKDGVRPIVFGTMLNHEVRDLLSQGSCCYIELYETFIAPLSVELGVQPSRKVGQSHGLTNARSYDKRISSINFAMANDDGMRLDNYQSADVVLTGVSRSGKTPTCLYLAMHFGLRAANYPLTDRDLGGEDIPKPLLPYRRKLFGLTIDAQRLQGIRQERRPDSAYASLARCRQEVIRAERIFQRAGVRVVDTTNHSIEEIASQIVKLI